MFFRARLKLTGWYLFIIMAISILFSFAIYTGLKNEIERSLRLQEFRMYSYALPPGYLVSPDQIQVDPDLLSASENRIKLTLLIVNLFIFFASGATSYFLAGKTLKPISDMVDEQNRFISDASHELRTPLTSLRSEIEVNLRDEKLKISDLKKILKSNLEEVENLQNLSDNLLLLTQEKQNSKNKLNLENVDLKPILEKAISKTLPLAKAKNIEIKTEIKNYKILGSYDELMQVFIIILDNAIKYSPSKTQIKVLTLRTDGKISVDITDQGFGIKDTDLPHIFKRFFRGDTSRTKQKINGFGLGLSIAKKIIEEHHGSIDVKSKMGIGSTFIVQLPIV